MPAPISLTWLALTLALLIYTFWDAPRWYKTPVHSVMIAAVTYGPAHFLTMQWSPAAEVGLFIVACALWATFLHKTARFALWDLPPYVPKQRTATKTVAPQIADAYAKLGIPQPGSEAPQPTATRTPPTAVEIIEDPSTPFNDEDEDEWEIFTPTQSHTNGVAAL